MFNNISKKLKMISYLFFIIFGGFSLLILIRTVINFLFFGYYYLLGFAIRFAFWMCAIFASWCISALIYGIASMHEKLDNLDGRISVIKREEHSEDNHEYYQKESNNYQ